MSTRRQWADEIYRNMFFAALTGVASRERASFQIVAEAISIADDAYARYERDLQGAWEDEHKNDPPWAPK